MKVSEELGPLALKGSIHMSMFDIHAACEHEDEESKDEEEIKQFSR